MERMLYDVFNPVQETIQNVTQSLLNIGGNLRDKTFDVYDTVHKKIKGAFQGIMNTKIKWLNLTYLKNLVTAAANRPFSSEQGRTKDIFLKNVLQFYN